MAEVAGITQAVAPTLPPRVAQPASGSGFAVLGLASADGVAANAAMASRAPGESAAAAALTGLLALQEAEGEAAPRDRDARRRGQDILAALADLQRALLGGGGVDGSLDRLAALLVDLPAASDPGLAAILAAIRLRARVELARRRGQDDAGATWNRKLG